LQCTGGAVFARTTTEPRSSSLLHPLLADLLAEAGVKPENINRLGITVGPGSFTGARVAVAVAEAWGLAQPHTQIIGLHSLLTAAKSAPTYPCRVLADAAGGQLYGQDMAADGQPHGAAICLPLAEAVITDLPILAINLPLLEEAKWRLTGLDAATLLAGVADPACHAPLAALYLKPLAYKEKAAI
jgi:tRNA A37 threonylcarbamoyladenosine modification protein TsaB